MRKKPLCLLIERKDPFEEELITRAQTDEPREEPEHNDKPILLVGLPLPSSQATEISLSGNEHGKKAK